MLDFCGSGPCSYALDLGLVHCDGVLRNHQTQKLDRGLFKLALFRLHEQIMLSEFLKDALCELTMEREIICKDDNVVDVYCDMSCGDFLLQDVVHHGLEGAGRIAESECHNRRFVESLMCDERGFLFVAFSDSHIVVTPSEVKRRENRGLGEAIDEVGDSRNGELVLLGDCVEGAIVLDQAYTSVFFRDEEDGCCGRTMGHADVLLVFLLLDPCIQ